jgi:hypothetical protein
MEGHGFDSEIESFSPIEESSLEASTNAYCIFGKCLARNSYGRRCPVGYRVIGSRRCGFWRNRIRATGTVVAAGSTLLRKANMAGLGLWRLSLTSSMAEVVLGELYFFMDSI